MGAIRRDAGAGGAAEEAILALLARFGFARPAQVARHIGTSAGRAEAALREMAARGLIHPVVVDGRPEAVGLTPAGTRRLPALLPKQRVTVGHAPAVLAAVDLAHAVESGGAARWLSWAEAVRAGLALPQPGRALAPAEGVILPGPRAPAAPHPHRVPACVVLRDPGSRALRTRLLQAVQATGASEVRVFAPAEAAGRLRAHVQGLPCAVSVEPLPPSGPTRGSGARGGAAPRRPAPLTPKRARVLQLLAAFGYATVDQVARMQGTRSTAASIMLASLERSGLVARHRRHHLHKDVYSPTAAGLEAVGSPLPAVPRVPVQRRHSLALLDLAHDLCAETGGRWQTQRELGQAGPAGRTPPHGRLDLPDGRRIAVRLELSSEPRHAVLALAERELGAGGCDEVWFVVAPEWQRRYAARLVGRPRTAVRAWSPPDRLGGPKGFRDTRSRGQRRSPSVRTAVR